MIRVSQTPVAKLAARLLTIDKVCRLGIVLLEDLGYGFLWRLGAIIEGDGKGPSLCARLNHGLQAAVRHGKGIPSAHRLLPTACPHGFRLLTTMPFSI